MLKKAFRIVGLGNPLLDISAEVPHTVLDRYKLSRGNAVLATQDQLSIFQELVSQYKDTELNKSGIGKDHQR
jgi:adenosine kinase